MIAERRHRLLVRTPEGVAFSFRIASPALRALSLVIDRCTIAAAWSVVAILLRFVQLVSVDWAEMIGVIGYFLFSEGYGIATEWLWGGQTLGKRLLRLRVVDERGLRLGFTQVALRNLLRFVDVLPLFYLVGGAAALASRNGQRLGDLAAGTLVIWEPEEPAPNFAVFAGGKYNSLREHPPVVARLRHLTSPAAARVAWQALARRDRLDPEARVQLFGEVAAHFRGLTPLPPEAADGVADEQLVRNIVEVLFVRR